MKKIIWSFLAVVMLLSFVGCYSTDKVNNGGETDNNETTTVYSQEQRFAEKLLTECADSFKNPFSIKVKNVWVYKFEYTAIEKTDYYFTFEFDVKNGIGVVETVYYGNHNASPFADILDSTAENEGYKFANGLSNKFNKDGVYAMQQGEKLDAQAVQEYLMKNL